MTVFSSSATYMDDFNNFSRKFGKNSFFLKYGGAPEILGTVASLSHIFFLKFRQIPNTLRHVLWMRHSADMFNKCTEVFGDIWTWPRHAFPYIFSHGSDIFITGPYYLWHVHKFSRHFQAWSERHVQGMFQICLDLFENCPDMSIHVPIWVRGLASLEVEPCQM